MNLQNEAERRYALGELAAVLDELDDQEPDRLRVLTDRVDDDDFDEDAAEEFWLTVNRELMAIEEEVAVLREAGAFRTNAVMTVPPPRVMFAPPRPERSTVRTFERAAGRPNACGIPAPPSVMLKRNVGDSGS